jgi:hypothetical protein
MVTASTVEEQYAAAAGTCSLPDLRGFPKSARGEEGHAL